MNPLITIVGRFVSTMAFLLGVIVQTPHEQIITNLKDWLPPATVDFLLAWHQFIEGFALAFMIVFWLGPLLLKAPPHLRNFPPIKPRFISLFGTYTLGQVNICEADGLGSVSGRIINEIKERDKLAKVETIIPFLLYEVKLISPNELAIVYLKRSLFDEEFRMIKFGIT